MDRPVLILWAPGVGRRLSRALIAEGLPIVGVVKDSVRVVNHCPVCGSSEHGRPALTPLRGQPAPHVSISYATDLTMVALTWAGPVGLDVERADAAASARQASIVLVGDTVENGPTLTTWVRMESLLKSTGRGLTVDPRQVQLTRPDEAPALVAWRAAHPPPAPVWIDDVEITDEHVAALTVLAPHRPNVMVKRAGLAASSGSASG